MPNLKGAGRKKGQKDLRPRITLSEKHRAKMLFITGATIQEIMRTLNLTSANTLYKMMHKDNWLEEREKYQKEKEQDYFSRTIRERKEVTEATLQDLKQIKERAMEIIPNVDDEKVRFSEAVNAYTTSTELERRIGAEGVENAFISIIVKAIRESIQDPVLLAKVGQNIVKVWDEYRNRPALISNTGQENAQQE